MFYARPSDTHGFRPAGLLLPDLEHVVNIFRTDIQPIQDPVKDPHLCLATTVVELCHPVVVSTWVNIKVPAVRLACLAEADNPAKRLALLIQPPRHLQENCLVCRHEVQASAPDFRCGQEHVPQFRAITCGVVR